MPSRVLKASSVVFTDPFGIAPVSTHAQAHREEVDAAYEQGLRDAQVGAMNALPTLVASLDTAVEELRASWSRQSAADRRAIVDAAAELAQWMVGRELEHDPTLTLAQADDAVANVVSDEAVTLFVAPEMVEIIESAWRPARPASVIPDPTLLRGELRVVAGASTADLRWAVALDRAREALDAVDGVLDD